LDYETQWPAGCHGYKRSKEERGVRVSKTLAVFARLAFTSPGKKCDKQLTHIVRVIGCLLLISFYFSMLKY